MIVAEWFDALQWIHIVLVAAILILFGLYIFALIITTRLIQGGFISRRYVIMARVLRRYVIVARVLGILFGSLVVTYLFYNLDKIEAVDWIEISLLVGLVGATGLYALLTFRQSSASMRMAEEMREQAAATSQQADASVNMAEEMKQQRYSESLPLLVPTIPDILPSEKLFYEAIASGVGVKVIWRNVGKGVAINSRFSFWTAPTSPGKAHFFPPRESVTLEVGGKKTVDYNEILNDGQLRDIPEEYCPYLLAEYQDIYERKITTVQEFRIDVKRVSLGELYFTVNGRRLGEELKKND